MHWNTIFSLSLPTIMTLLILWHDRNWGNVVPKPSLFAVALVTQRIIFPVT